jgi:hypothetical protein
MSHFIPTRHTVYSVCTSVSNASQRGWEYERHPYMEMCFRTDASLGSLHWFSHDTREQYALYLCELLS